MKTGLLIGGFLMAALLGCALYKTEEKNYTYSNHYYDGKFHNFEPISLMNFKDTFNMLKRFVFEKRIDPIPTQPLPVIPLTPTRLAIEQSEHTSLYRLGHSSLLLSLKQEFWLIDPVFSERVSPFSWMGPKRFHAPPISIEALPKIKGIIISHDHYDHLDEETIKALADRVTYFVVPLGVGKHLRNWGVSENKIHELDWWEDIVLGELTLTATPAQHFSGRGIADRDKTLWCSWVIRIKEERIFFSGDSGYFSGFKRIGKKYGPFDLTILENGAYSTDWAQVHMTPEETLQAHIDLKGKALLAVHNGTFDLAMHSWYEPLERLTTLAEQQQIKILTPKIGEKISMTQLNQVTRWWQEYMPIKN